MDVMTSGSVLIVDDDPVFLRLARFLLEAEGFEVDTAPNATEAQFKATAHSPHLMLVDTQLPGIDGLELTRRLKNDPNTRSIQVLAVSSYSVDGYEESARDAGCDGCITKPIDASTFAGIIRRRLGAVFATQRALRVLVADDDPDITTLVGVALKKCGIDCKVVHDGGTALDTARRFLPDVLVLDVMMPDLDGFGVLMSLKREESTRHVKVIMLTSCDKESDLMRGFGLGADDYVTKPFNPLELAARVTRFNTSLPAMTSSLN